MKNLPASVTEAVEENQIINHWLREKLEGKPVLGTSGNEEHTMHPQVSIGTAMPKARGFDAEDQHALLQIDIADGAVIHHPDLVRNTLMSELSRIPELAAVAQLDSDKDHMAKLKQQLKSFVDKGARLSPNVTEWGGFNAELSSGWDGVQDHAVSHHKRHDGIQINIAVPMTDAQQKNSKPVVEALEKNFKDRTNAIKKDLTARIGLYQGALEKSTGKVLDQTKLTAIEQKVNALNIRVEGIESQNGNGISSPAQLSITISSPEQVKYAGDIAKLEGLSEDERKKVFDSNILSELGNEQLGKALGRTLLHSGEKSQEVFLQIAGREDMKNAIGKALTRLKKEKPELAGEVDAFLNDDTFKDHQNWRNSKNLKAKPVFEKLDDKPVLRITIPTSKDGQADELITALSKRAQEETIAAAKEAAVPQPETAGFLQSKAVNEILERYRPANADIASRVGFAKAPGQSWQEAALSEAAQNTGPAR